MNDNDSDEKSDQKVKVFLTCRLRQIATLSPYISPLSSKEMTKPVLVLRTLSIVRNKKMV